MVWKLERSTCLMGLLPLLQNFSTIFCLLIIYILVHLCFRHSFGSSYDPGSISAALSCLVYPPRDFFPVFLLFLSQEVQCITKLLMTGPAGNSVFFLLYHNVPLGFTSGNIKVLGESKLTFPLGPVIKCLWNQWFIWSLFVFILQNLCELFLSLWTSRY